DYAAGLSLDDFSGFSTLTVDPGAYWKVVGNSALPTVSIGAGATVASSANFTATVTLDAGSYFENSTNGTITSAGYGIAGVNGAVTVVNLGTVTGTNAAIHLAAGGTVVNGSTVAPVAYIGSGSSGAIAGSGIIIVGGAGTVVNFGTIRGNYTGPQTG